MITVTGATGHLGRLVVRSLLDRGVPAGEVTAAVRSPEKAADLAALGVRVVAADYDDPDSLPAALAGTDRLLLVSGSVLGQRERQHANVIRAAVAAGVGSVAYTSILRADTSTMLIAREHLATERLILDSGLPYTFLRNSWYVENYTRGLDQVLAAGAMFGSAGDGRVSLATRADYAEAAAAVVAVGGHEGAAYELGGDQAYTLAEVAAEIGRQAGAAVAYRNLSAEESLAGMTGAGLPEPVAAVLADADRGLAAGELFTDSGDLSRLAGRPTTPLADALAAAVKAADRG